MDIVTVAIARRGKPTWTEEAFERLMRELGHAGYVWVNTPE